MSNVKFEIQGLESLEEKFKRLNDPKMLKSAVRKALRQGANIVRNAAREEAKKFDRPDTPNKVWKQIVVQSGRTRSKNEFKMRVGVRGGARIPYTNNDQNRRSGKVGKTYATDGHHFYWRFIEFGSSHQPAAPFMRPALVNNVDNATAKVALVLNDEINKALASAL